MEERTQICEKRTFVKKKMVKTRKGRGNKVLKLYFKKLKTYCNIILKK